RRLLPFVLFRSRAEFETAAAKDFEKEKQLADCRGYARRDCVMTYLGDSIGPILRHEATHQLFGRRILLQGGGAWFQEGLAEYVSSSPQERRAFAERARTGRVLGLRRLAALESLLGGAFGFT